MFGRLEDRRDIEKVQRNFFKHLQTKNRELTIKVY